ncbi:hypothetical protein BaRGS_00013527, partial [Batillaria attramentaria]
ENGVNLFFYTSLRTRKRNRQTTGKHLGAEFTTVSSLTTSCSLALGTGSGAKGRPFLMRVAGDVTRPVLSTIATQLRVWLTGGFHRVRKTSTK